MSHQRFVLVSAATFLLSSLLVPASAQQAKKKFGAPGEINTPPARGERAMDTLRVGDAAPDFTLPSVTGEGSVKLSSFKGKKPVVLIFGSYT
jgi:hypothetical protein